MNYRAIVFETLLKELPGLKSALEGFDFESIPVIHGKEVMPLLHEKHPQVVILDVFMPQLSGLEVCRLIKEETNLNTKVILLTSNPSETLKSRSENYSCDLYLMKEEAEAKIVEFLPNCQIDIPIAGKTNETEPSSTHPQPKEEKFSDPPAANFDDASNPTPPRFEISGDITFTYDGKDFHGELINASTSGVLFAAPMEIPVGIAVKLEFESASGDTFSIDTTVARCASLKSPKPNLKIAIGAKLESLSPEDAERIQTLIEFKTKGPIRIEPDALQQLLGLTPETASFILQGGADSFQLKNYIGTLNSLEKQAFKSEGEIWGTLKKLVIFRAQTRAFYFFLPMLEADRKRIGPIFIPLLKNLMNQVEGVENTLDTAIQEANSKGDDGLRRGLIETSNRLHDNKIKLLFQCNDIVTSDGLPPTDKATLEDFKQKAVQIRSFEKNSAAVLKYERRQQPKPTPPKEDKKKKKKEGLVSKRWFQITAFVIAGLVGGSTYYGLVPKKIPTKEIDIGISIDRITVNERELEVKIFSIDWSKMNPKAKKETLEKIIPYMKKSATFQTNLIDENQNRLGVIASGSTGQTERAYMVRVLK